MTVKLKNNASGTLATAVSASDTGVSLTTGNGANFPTLTAPDYFYATLASSGGTTEVVKVTARSGDSLTVVRAQESTTAQSFAAGSRIEMRVTAQSVLDAINGALNYLGPYATDPTLRNDGSALQAGDLYFNTTVSELRVYNGSAWQSIVLGGTTVQRFSGNGSTTAFVLSTVPATENTISVYIQGVYQQKDTYSVAGSTLNFSEAPVSGTDNIEVVTIQNIAIGTTSAAMVSITDSGGFYSGTDVEAALQQVIQFVPSGTGAVATTVQTKLRETVSVKDFGVTGNGTTNDAAALAAITTFPGFFPAGTYNIGSDVAGLGKQFYGFGKVVFAGAGKVQTPTAYGIGALANNTGFNTGAPTLTDKNTAFGTRSLYNNTTGYHNTAVGDEALFTNITGTQNTAVGMNALLYNTGNNNTAVGTSALLNTSTGADNVAVGRAAGQGNTTGSSNTLIGRNAGWQKATGDNDTAVGYECYWDSTASGGSNSAFGFRASYRLTTGTRNTTLGNESGYNVGAATDVVAVGHRAAFTTTANETIAVGSLSLNLLTTGARNTAVGFRAGEAITTVTDNTFVGWRAGYLVTGAQNVIIGSQAAPVLTSGASSTIIGQSAGSALTTGFFNTLIGQGAGSNITTGGSNTVIGRGAVASAAGVNNEITVTGGSTTIRIGGGLQWLSGAGTPEAAVTAPVGSLYTRTDGGASTTLYVKESGTGNTGWIAK